MQSNHILDDRGLFTRWARFAVRRRRLVLAGWVAALVTVIVLWQTMGAAFGTSFSLPGTESQEALDLLKERYPQRAGDEAQLVFKAEAGINDPAVRPRIEEILAKAAQLPEVVNVESPLVPNSRAISQDGRIAYATLQYGTTGDQIDRGAITALLKLADSSGGNGLAVEAGGTPVQQNEGAPPGAAEGIGLLAAVFILLVAFGSVVAMGLPLVTAVIGLGVSFALMGLAANFLDLPLFSGSFASMIGIGVGIDYALFIVTRYREGLRDGHTPEDAAVIAVTTAGRAVLFAGIVVALSLLGLLAMGIPFIGALGIAGAIVVGVAVLVALTLLPALLGFAGRAIDRWRLPMFHATDTGEQSTLWYRLSRQIQARPLLWFAGSLGLLLLMAAPVTRIHLGFSDAGNGGENQHSRRAYDLLTEGFGPGFNAPLLIVFDTKNAQGDRQTRLGAIREQLAATAGIAQVSPPIPNPAGDAAILTAFPAYAPQDDRLSELVYNLRENVIPEATRGSGIRAYVAGANAAYIDIGDRITERMPLFFGAVIGLSFLLLVLIFRSVLVPLKAAIMNLLSIGAAYGVVVAVFQWGWGADLLGIKPGPIEVFLPMMLFAILFGLSMDYEVFLISRIREEYGRTGDNGSAVAHGLAVTARVITAAASIMIVVFLSFVLGTERVIKEFGVGLATAIVVDATIVRLILVPATMELLGDANWWLPRWLDRLLPNLDLEGDHRPERERVPVVGD